MRTGNVNELGQLVKALQVSQLTQIQTEVVSEMGEVIKPYQASAAAQAAKRHVDITGSLHNFQAEIDKYNDGKTLGEMLKQQHKNLLHKLVVLLSNTKSIITHQVNGNYYYVVNTDAKAIASEGNYVGQEPEKAIKAHIDRLTNLPSHCFLVMQIGERKNQYRYLIGLSKDLITWKDTAPK